MIFLWASLLLLLAYAALMAWYARGWHSLKEPDLDAQASSVFLSVLVPARNEAERIGALLRALRRQTYRHFEVLVIDDHSTDGTAEVVHSFEGENIRLIPSGVEEARSSKKRAIEAGVRAARGALIVATDADCLPPPQWLEALAGFHERTGARFIAAPVRFTHDGSLLQTFQALDFLMLQGVTAASVASGFHSMCNGANLAYTREAFDNVNGFSGIDRVATGDDMLLMHKIWKQEPSRVHYLRSRAAIVDTPPMPTLRSFLNQRRRWASKTLVYEDYRIIAVIGLVGLLNLWWIVLLVAACFQPLLFWAVLAYVLLKGGIEYAFLRPVARFYGASRLLPLLFAFQPLHLLYTVGVGLSSFFGRYEWKGRRTR